MCPRCQRETPTDAKFCSECGTRVDPSAGRPARTAVVAERLLAASGVGESERKQVTVMFADLKGSMELLADRDPEEAQKLLDPVLEHMMEAVHHHEGTVNQVMGDGIMALFGAPVAHEDHAVRACYAALRMQESVTRYGDEVLRQHGAPLQIRVGLNSGEVVVRTLGGDLHTNYAAVGQTVHLAARMEQMAKPGSIFATADTVRLARPWVEAKSLGPVRVKGLEPSVEVYEVTGLGAARSRLQAAATRGLTRFVGREVELGVLRAALDRIRSGESHVVGLVGEVGVGKSRLLREFVDAPWLGDCLV
ncbi:MAG: adenylate/guanylate cyclase domain-containing protein, partial [Candidatus Rokuibacteriota bacterium]